MVPTFEGRVVAIVVTYRPDMSRLHQVVLALSAQVERVVLVDNSGDTQANADVRSLEHAGAVEVVSFAENMGIGYGLNTGIDRAAAYQASHVLLMDQDSIPAPGMVEALLSAHEVLVERGKRVAAVGPRLYDRASGRVAPLLRFNMRFGATLFDRVDDVAEVDFVITSGCLIDMQVLQAVGGMDGDLFIDHVDTEWVQRAWRRGYVSAVAGAARMNHDLGEFRRRVWLLRWREVPFHKPFRYYYIFRNSVALYRRPYMRREWLRFDVVRLLQIAVYMTIFHPQRLEFLRMMVKGLRDGFHQRLGKMAG